MEIPKLSHLGIDEWKLEQIINLYEGGFSPTEIGDQVDIEEKIVSEAIALAHKDGRI